VVPKATGVRSELDEAIEKLVREVKEGLKHGFFDFAVSCESVKGGKRRLTIKAGKSHQFMIRPEDLVG